MTVAGQGIPAGAYIRSINSSNRLTLSVPSTATVTGELSIDNSQFTLTGEISGGSNVVQNVNTSRLVPGMTVTVPGNGSQIPSGTTIASIDSPTQLTLSTSATAGATLLTFTGMNLDYQQQTGTFALDKTSKYTVINGIDTSKLTTGMTVTGGSLPAGDTIASILGPRSISLAAPAAAGGSAFLTFKGTNLGTALGQNLYASQSEAATQEYGLVLADAIRQAIAPNFFSTASGGTGGGLIHLLGHSHGSKVADVAALCCKTTACPSLSSRPSNLPRQARSSRHSAPRSTPTWPASAEPRTLTGITSIK